MKKLYELLLANKSLEAGFEAFVAPELFTNHEDFASFPADNMGNMLSVDLVEKYKYFARFRPNIKCVYEVRKDIDSVQIAPFAAGTCLYGETIGSVEIVIPSANIVAFTKGSTKRWVAAYTNNTQTYQVPIGTVCAYFINIDYPSSAYMNTTLMYVFVEDLSRITLNLPQQIFRQNQNLTGRVHLPIGVESISGGAFENTKIYGDIELPETLTYATGFSGCPFLTGDLIIPPNLISFERGFDGCVGLDGVLQINSAPEVIGGYTFRDCRKLIGDIVIPKSVKVIQTAAFWGTNSLAGDIDISGDIEEIQYAAFWACGAKGIITLGENIKTIGQQSFLYVAPKYTKILATAPPTLFHIHSLPNGDIYVPDGLDPLGSGKTIQELYQDPLGSFGAAIAANRIKLISQIPIEP